MNPLHHRLPERRSHRAVPINRRRQKQAGFTLLEILVAMVILVVAFTVVWSTFSAVMKAWRKGDEVLQDMHHGDFLMEQIVSVIRSVAYFSSAPGTYGFWLEDNESGKFPADEISLVTSSAALMPIDSATAIGLHRIYITIDDNDDGDPSVAISAHPHLADPEEDDLDIEPWYVSTMVKGFDCRTFNEEDEDWEDEWEDTNAIPKFIQITLYMDPLEKYGDPVEISRVIELPVSVLVTQPVNVATSGRNNRPGSRGNAGTAPRARPGQNPGQSNPGQVTPAPPESSPRRRRLN